MMHDNEVSRGRDDSEASAVVFPPSGVEPAGAPPIPEFVTSGTRPTGETARPTASASAPLQKLTWLMIVLAVLLALSYFVPYFAEEIQYALTRGRQRAEYENGFEQLRSGPLSELSKAYQLISQRVGPSVVHINVASSQNTARGTAFSHPRGYRTEGQGSGVIVDRAGFILTNHHVVRDASEIQVSLSDGRVVPGYVVGDDELTDLAVLQVDADNLVAAEWGNSDELNVGSLVWALGSPFGLEQSVTSGILSAKHRSHSKHPSQYSVGTPYQDFLQTDAAVNPGNSGGPLVDANGRVVGINTAIVGDSYEGVSFAVPSRVARKVFERLRDRGEFERGYLGIGPEAITPALQQQLGLVDTNGAYVFQVASNGDPRNLTPAEAADVRVGDVVRSWNGAAVDTPARLFDLIGQTEVGTQIEMVVIRDGKPLTLNVTVGKRPIKPR